MDYFFRTFNSIFDKENILDIFKKDLYIFIRNMVKCEIVLILRRCKLLNISHGSVT